MLSRRRTPDTTTLTELIEARLTRRAALGGLFAGSALALLGRMLRPLPARAAATPSSLGFTEIPHAISTTHNVAPGYTANVLMRCGDPLLPGAPEWDPRALNAPDQARQFGYNNDYLAFMPLPAGSGNSNRGLLHVNHEYTNAELMWPGLSDGLQLNRDQVDVEMAAHGFSVLEVAENGGHWSVVPNSRYARRVTLATPMRISGPAAGHPRLRTRADPDGNTVFGTVNNCAGGHTPWGTVLAAEENFHFYFGGKVADSAETRNLNDYGIGHELRYAWHRYHERFDVEAEPREPNRFGWMVENDPYDPGFTPVKRTALGRIKHEAAGMAVDRNGQVAAYCGDDERFQFLYKFVSRGRFDAAAGRANGALLDDGTLFAARFEADGRLIWLPLIHGQGPLTARNGFESQADVLIETRRAAALLGATTMDRPEDVEVHPITGRIYVVLTNNTKRKADQLNPANPRPNNRFGHLIEIVPPGPGGARDHVAVEAQWNVFLLAGDPRDQAIGAHYHPLTSPNGWMANPDNLAVDKKGRLWIATDQGPDQGKNAIPDGLYACDTEGEGRALTRFFFACPLDAEMCGPEFTPDGRTLFLAVQHPGEGSTFDKPTTRWPDFRDDRPPRPAVLAITKSDGGEIGG